MNPDHEEQTRWLVSYLESRFTKLEDRLDRAIDKVDQAILAQSEAITKVEERVTQVEVKQTKLDGQAGFLKNILAFVGTIVLSLVGWLASTFLLPPGK